MKLILVALAIAILIIGVSVMQSIVDKLTLYYGGGSACAFCAGIIIIPVLLLGWLIMSDKGGK